MKDSEKIKRTKFWKLDDKAKPKIIEGKLMEFISVAGFGKAKISDTNYVFVKESKNTVCEIGDDAITDYVKKYLEKINEPDVYEVFVRGSSSYISKGKLRFIESVELVNDRDDAESSWFHFSNLSWQVDEKSYRSTLREDITAKIWKSRIIPHDVYPTYIDDKGQFFEFCYNISGQDKTRLKSLKTILGYLLHRNHNPSNTKAIILVDEKISFDGTANGGTGKSLLVQALGKCRELVVVDGKNIKHNSWFKNQRINRTTDIVFYDDVGKKFSLESLYSMITTGIPIEKKYKDEEFIEPENAPKICISSNYIVNGPGGSTDIRRRCEFEVANYYTSDFSPFDEFGNYFFVQWDQTEWNCFFHFMMHCVQTFLKYGLVEAKPINLKKNRLINATSEEFVAFMDLGLIEVNTWISKPEILTLFRSDNPHYNILAPHQMTKWMKEYAKQNQLVYHVRKSGVKYEFYLQKLGEEVQDEEE